MRDDGDALLRPLHEPLQEGDAPAREVARSLPLVRLPLLVLLRGYLHRVKAYSWTHLCLGALIYSACIASYARASWTQPSREKAAQKASAYQGEVDGRELLLQVRQRPSLITWVLPYVLPAALRNRRPVSQPNVTSTGCSCCALAYWPRSTSQATKGGAPSALIAG